MAVWGGLTNSCEKKRSEKLHSRRQQIRKTQQWPQDWKRSVFTPIPKKGNAKERSNHGTIALISHTSKLMLKILQTRLQQYVNCELPDVQAGFRKGRGTRNQICSLAVEAWNPSHWTAKQFQSPHFLIHGFGFYYGIKRVLGARALGRPRGMVWGGRREEGSGWGTHVYLWRIHFDIWQN